VLQGTLPRQEKTPTEQEKILTNPESKKDVRSKTCKELLLLKNKARSQITETRSLNTHFTEELIKTHKKMLYIHH
jgi:hypothetical protein